MFGLVEDDSPRPTSLPALIAIRVVSSSCIIAPLLSSSDMSSTVLQERGGKSSSKHWLDECPAVGVKVVSIAICRNGIFVDSFPV